MSIDRELPAHIRFSIGHDIFSGPVWMSIFLPESIFPTLDGPSNHMFTEKWLIELVKRVCFL